MNSISGFYPKGRGRRGNRRFPYAVSSKNYNLWWMSCIYFKKNNLAKTNESIASLAV